MPLFECDQIKIDLRDLNKDYFDNEEFKNEILINFDKNKFKF